MKKIELVVLIVLIGLNFSPAYAEKKMAISDNKELAEKMELVLYFENERLYDRLKKTAEFCKKSIEYHIEREEFWKKVYINELEDNRPRIVEKYKKCGELPYINDDMSFFYDGSSHIFSSPNHTEYERKKLEHALCRQKVDRELNHHNASVSGTREIVEGKIQLLREKINDCDQFLN